MQTYTALYTSRGYNSNGVVCMGKVISRFEASDDFMAMEFAKMFLTNPGPSNFVISLDIEILDEANTTVFQKTIKGEFRYNKPLTP